MGKRTPPVTVAECPDAGDIGAELVIDNDEAMRILLHARLLETEIIRVGPAPGRDQQVGASNLLRSVVAVDRQDDMGSSLSDTETVRLWPNCDAFLGQEAGYGF